MTLTVDLILAIVAALVLGGWIGAHYGRAEGRHEGRMEERERWLERNRRAEEKRYVPPPTPIRAKTGPVRPALQMVRPSEYSGWGPPKRTHTSPANIGQVFLPGRPQPGRTSITDTGELHLRAQAFIDKMAADDVEWRAKTGLLT